LAVVAANDELLVVVVANDDVQAALAHGASVPAHDDEAWASSIAQYQ
jgi:hypothetical protein